MQDLNLWISDYFFPSPFELLLLYISSSNTNPVETNIKDHDYTYHKYKQVWDSFHAPVQGNDREGQVMKEMIKVEKHILNSVIFLMFLSQKRENNMAKHNKIGALLIFSWDI